MDMQKELLKAADVAPQLGVTTGRVYQLIAAGSIPATRLGRSIRIPRRAWESWVGEQNAHAQASMHVTPEGVHSE